MWMDFAKFSWFTNMLFDPHLTKTDESMQLKSGRVIPSTGVAEQDECQSNGGILIPLQGKNIHIYVVRYTYIYIYYTVYRYDIPGYTSYIHLLHIQPMKHRGPVGPPPFYGKEAGILLKGTKIEQPQTRKNAKFMGIQNKCVGVVACVFLEFWG